jgi:O-Antigen ligase
MAAIGATCLVSIFAAQALLALALVVFAVRLGRRHTRFPRLGLDGPTLAFSVWTLLAAAFSTDPLRSHEDAKKLVLFLLLYLTVEACARPERRERVVGAALMGGLALAVGMLLEFYFLGSDTLNQRPHSLLGHYMTASGLVMGALVLGAARLAFLKAWPARPGKADLRALALFAAGLAILTLLQRADLFAIEGKRLVVAGLMLAAGFGALRGMEWPSLATGTWLAGLTVGASSWALLISRTRSAWLGAVAGLAVVAILRAPRLLWLLGAGLLAVLVTRPTTVMDRLTVFDASSVDRYFMWQAGIDMIAEKPIFGQGPGMILQLYPRYRWPGAPNADAPHLHDNALQIAAERGLPCLAWWVWWVATALADAYREFRRARSAPDDVTGPSPWPAAASLAVLTAVLVAGLFEYNFGDSEVLMFTLIVVALPYSMRHARARSETAA